MASNFHLEVGADRLATLTFDTPDKKLNVFTRTALQELETVLQELAGRQDIGCLILLSGKPGGFIAGADVEEIARVTDPVEAEAGSRVGHRLFAAWEALPSSGRLVANGVTIETQAELIHRFKSLGGTYAGLRALAGLRIATGFIFLWAFLDKLFGLGYSTASAKSWIHGGSPTKGYLSRRSPLRRLGSPEG